MKQQHIMPIHQDVLVNTIHNQESVVEVYFNRTNNLITELKHLTQNRVKVYQYDLDDYLENPIMRGTKNKLLSILGAEV